MAKNVYEGGYAGERVGSSPIGRWPANVIHDGSEEVLDAFAAFGVKTSGNLSPVDTPKKNEVFGKFSVANVNTFNANSGSAARFFYSAKASKKERRESKHLTVKPISLMRYLVRLVTPPSGLVLDPFMGSGSTIEAANLEGFQAIGIDLSEEYCTDAVRRLSATT
jgi:site-specific DNA-methyltransferase (adenine-specific)